MYPTMGTVPSEPPLAYSAQKLIEERGYEVLRVLIGVILDEGTSLPLTILVGQPCWYSIPVP